MASRFPDAASLGPTPVADPSRAIGSYDVRPLTTAGQQLGAGVAQVGEGMGELADASARYQFMQAHADYLAKSVDLQTQFANDQDYSTLADRYDKAATDLRDQTAQSIGSPGLRNRFIAMAGDTIARGNQWAMGRARQLSNNADVADVDAAGDKLAGAFSATTDEDMRHKIIGSYGARVDSLAATGAISQVQAYQMKRTWGTQVASADALTRIQNGDAQGVLNDLRTAPASGEQIDNRTIQLESGGNPLARSRSSSALGLGQFEPATWLSLVRQAHPEYASMPDDQVLALRADPKLSREMVTANRVANTQYLQGKGVDATPGNIYLAHFLGPQAAAAVAQASPNMPVETVLTNAVGADAAQKMIHANPTVLNGMTAGSVAQWASDRMGGVGPGGGHLYDVLQPEARAQLEDRAQAALHKQNADGLSQLKTDVDNTLAEAGANGSAKNPVAQEEFIARLGPQLGADQFQKYSANLKAAADMHSVAQLSPDQQQSLLASYTPKPGAPDFADQLARQKQIAETIKAVQTQVQADPATFAVTRLPTVQDAYQKFTSALGNPAVSADDRAAAAKDYVNKQLMEQQRIGVSPDAVRILPKGYAESFNAAIDKAAASDDPNGRVAMIARIQQEQQLWGDAWPMVMRELAPQAQPLVRAIAAGADVNAMTRLLSLPKNENPAQILKEQNATKASDLTSKLDDAMAPFLGTLVGRQRDRDYPGYYDLANKLAALHVRDGMSASDAASTAFNELVGNRYDFRDTYRIPKSAGVSADDVQAGAQLARQQLSAGGPKISIDSDLEAAKRDLNLTPQEVAFYQRHLTNLTGPGGVDNPDGSRSSLFQSVQERDGKFYNVPTVWNGKIETEKWTRPSDGKVIDVPNATAMANVERAGWDSFPSYKTPEQADARYSAMHDYMDEDTARFLKARSATPLANVKPAIDDIGLGATNAADSLAKFGRDGKWVTSPNNDGLNLAYGDKFVRTNDGQPLLMTWSQLAGLTAARRSAGPAPAPTGESSRAFRARQGVETAAPARVQPLPASAGG